MNLRQIDKAIAEKVFGAKIVERGLGENDLWEIYDTHSTPLSYFTFSDREVWRAFNKLTEKHTPLSAKITFNNFYEPLELKYKAEVSHVSGTCVGRGRSVPEALSKAIFEFSK